MLGFYCSPNANNCQYFKIGSGLGQENGFVHMGEHVENFLTIK
jgi:hypothetical protein